MTLREDAGWLIHPMDVFRTILRTQRHKIGAGVTTGWVALNADDISRLYAEHARALLRFLTRRTYDAEVAVDLLAETFAVAVAERSRFRGAGDAAAIAWIFGIARNLLNHWYRQAAVERSALRRLRLEPPDCGEAEYRRIEELAGLDELRRQVAARLGELSDQDQSALRLRIVQEREYADVAEELLVSEDTARARVSRALKRLASRMKSEEVAGHAG